MPILADKADYDLFELEFYNSYFITGAYLAYQISWLRIRAQQVLRHV